MFFLYNLKENKNIFKSYNNLKKYRILKEKKINIWKLRKKRKYLFSIYKFFNLYSYKLFLDYYFNTEELIKKSSIKNKVKHNNNIVLKRKRKKKRRRFFFKLYRNKKEENTKEVFLQFFWLLLSGLKELNSVKEVLFKKKYDIKSNLIFYDKKKKEFNILYKLQLKFFYFFIKRNYLILDFLRKYSLILNNLILEDIEIDLKKNNIYFFSLFFKKFYKLYKNFFLDYYFNYLNNYDNENKKLNIHFFYNYDSIYYYDKNYVDNLKFIYVSNSFFKTNFLLFNYNDYWRNYNYKNYIIKKFNNYLYHKIIINLFFSYFYNNIFIYNFYNNNKDNLIFSYYETSLWNQFRNISYLSSSSFKLSLKKRIIFNKFINK